MANPIPIATAFRQELKRVFLTVPGVVEVDDVKRPLESIKNYPVILFKCSGKTTWNRGRTFTCQYEQRRNIDVWFVVRADENELTDEKAEAIQFLLFQVLSADLQAGTIRKNLFSKTNGAGCAELLHIWPEGEPEFSVYTDKKGIAICEMTFYAEIRHSEYNI